jgi:hypothetical protein
MIEYDAFLSYQWNIKHQVKLLYEYLTENHQLKIWVDDYETEAIVSSNLYDEIAKAIQKAKVFICCITLDYSKSENCRRELVTKIFLFIFYFIKKIIY